MKGWILYRKKQSDLSSSDYSVNRFLAVARERGIDLELKRPESFDLIVHHKDDQKTILVDGVPTALPDFVIPRIGCNTSYFALGVIKQLERCGVVICNSAKTIETVKDKLKIHQTLVLDGIPMPKTMLFKYPVDMDLIAREIGFPLVIKNVTGTEGRGIHLCQTPADFKDLIELMYSYNKNMNLLVQEFIQESSGTDLRVFLIGGKVVACMKRTAVLGFKANYSLGGDVEKFQMTPEIEQLATTTARLLDLDITGIDLLFGANGFKVLEANSAPGLEGIEKASGLAIAELIFDYIQERVAARNKK